MKKLVLIMILSGLCSLNAGAVKVQLIDGEVRTKGSVQQSEWQAVQLNQILPDQSIIRTGGESKAELVFEDGSMVRVLDYSMLQISSAERPGQKPSDVFTLLGKFYFTIKTRLSGEFRIKTPTSVAEIRGTEFLINNTKSTSELWVRSGEVLFREKSSDRSVAVKAGFKSVVSEGKAASDPIPLSSAEMEQLNINSETGHHTPDPIFEMSAITEPGRKNENPNPPAPQAQTTPSYENRNAGMRELSSPDMQEQENIPEMSPRSTESGFGMGLAIGAVTIDNRIYNQIGLRPEFSIGKFGMALDLTLYIDEDGNIRDDNWDSFDDIIEKIYYVRWAQKGDPFYVKLGAIDNYMLGYGLLMRHYSNTIEYPTVIRTGMELGFQGDRLGTDILINDFKEIGKPGGLYAGRVTLRIVGGLTLGANVVYDRNQYASLRDRDDDGVPDVVDDFPGNKQYALDTDGDGVPDQTDPDRDGNGYTDNPLDDSLFNDYTFDPSRLKPDPFNINTARDKDQIAFAFDLGLPIVQSEYLQLILYSQAAKFGNGGGWGYTPIGFLSKFAFINFYGEFRMFEEKFIPEYFNTTYEIERAVFVTDETTDSTFISTKRQSLQLINERLKGFVVGADFNLWNVMVFGAEYQRMSKSAIKLNTFRAHLDLDTSFIPKISRAGAYYYQMNANKLFVRQEGTVLGYRFAYDISPSASLVFDYRVTYRDRNGDGTIKGSNEAIKTTNIQTVFRF